MLQKDWLDSLPLSRLQGLRKSRVSKCLYPKDWEDAGRMHKGVIMYGLDRNLLDQAIKSKEQWTKNN